MSVVTVVAVLALLVSVPVLYLRALRNEQWRSRKYSITVAVVATDASVVPRLVGHVARGTRR